MSFARKDKVRILRQESYWFNQIGEIVSIDKSPAMRYPVTVKFEKCDFKAFSGVDGGANTSQFSAKELEAAASAASSSRSAGQCSLWWRQSLRSS